MRDFRGEGGMSKRADVTAASTGQRSQREHYCRGSRTEQKEQHEGVSGPCTMTKSQRARGWKPRKVRSQVKTQRNWVKKLKEFKLGRLVDC